MSFSNSLSFALSFLMMLLLCSCYLNRRLPLEKKSSVMCGMQQSAILESRCNTHTHTKTQICKHTHTYLQIHIHTQTHIHTNTHTYTQTNTHTNTYTHIHKHTQMHTQKHTHNYAHTYKHAHSSLPTACDMSLNFYKISSS